MNKPNPFKKNPRPYSPRKIKPFKERIPSRNNSGERRRDSDWSIESVLNNKKFYFQGPIISQMFDNDEEKYKGFVEKYLAARKFRKENLPNYMQRPIADEDMALFNRFTKGEITILKWAEMAGVASSKITYLIGRIYARQLQTKTTK